MGSTFLYWQQVMKVGIDDAKGAGILPPTFKACLFCRNSVSASVLRPASSGAVISFVCCFQQQKTFRIAFCKVLPVRGCIVASGRDGCCQESFPLCKHNRKRKELTRWEWKGRGGGVEEKGGEGEKISLLSFLIFYFLWTFTVELQKRKQIYRFDFTAERCEVTTGKMVI